MWLLIAIALIGGGLAKAVEVAVAKEQRAKEEQLLAIGLQFQRAFASYYAVPAVNEMDRYPKEMSDLLLDGRSINPRRHLRKIFVDPLTGVAEWGEVRVGGRLMGVYSLSRKKAFKKYGFGPNLPGFEGVDQINKWVFMCHPPSCGGGAGIEGS